MNWKALALVVVLTAAAFAVLATAPSAHAATYINGSLLESAGHTTDFGGGDYVFVSFGTMANTDAAFGIVWGNASHANNIYVVAIKARYLGVGQVYNTGGGLVAANHPIKVYTIYMAQLQNIVEYRDVTGDGVANYSRTYDSVNKTWSGYSFTRDVGYKLVNLTANWVQGPIVPSNGTQYRSWTFSLSATNLSYYNITNKAKLSGALPLVTFTFHLNASLVQLNNVSVPQWNITVDQSTGRDTITNVARMSDFTLTAAKAVHYDLKWDQLISGWSYQPNDPVGQRRLLLEVGSVVVNWVPPSVLTGWAIIHQLGDDGTAHYNGTAADNQTVGNGTGAYAQPHVFRSPLLSFGGTWTQISRFEWISNSTVDGTNRTVYGQVEGGWGFAVLSSRGLYYGFVLLVGLNYYGGGVIVHDPTVSTDALVDTQMPSAPAGTSPAAQLPWGALIVAIVILVVLVLIIAAVYARRKKQEPPTQGPPAP